MLAACKKGRAEVVQVLVDVGKVRVCDFSTSISQESPLYLAIKSKNKRLIKYLAANFYAFIIDEENKLSGLTPLTLAMLTL